MTKDTGIRKTVSVIIPGTNIPGSVSLNEAEIAELNQTGDLKSIMARREPLKKAIISNGYKFEDTFLPQTHIITYDAKQRSEYYKYLDVIASRGDYDNHYHRVYRKIEDGVELFSLEGCMPYKAYKKYADCFIKDPYIELLKLRMAIEQANILMHNLATSAIGDWNYMNEYHLSNHRLIITPESLQEVCLKDPVLSEEEIESLKGHFDYGAGWTIGHYSGDGYEVIGGTEEQGLILEHKYNFIAEKR